uniref:Uncharacterized protein n=1 Tax=Rhizophora mucronata TaxID=61149 RepID=A0A2P2IXP5_RHIMU
MCKTWLACTDVSKAHAKKIMKKNTCTAMAYEFLEENTSSENFVILYRLINEKVEETRIWGLP